MRAANPVFGTENLRRAEPLLETLRHVADAHDAKPAQVALAWLLGLPQVVVIPGASSVEQLESNVAAAELDLAPDEQAALTVGGAGLHPGRSRAHPARQRARALLTAGARRGMGSAPHRGGGAPTPTLVRMPAPGRTLITS